jgi:hypothetical protein
LVVYEELSFEAATKEVANLDYKRRTVASYVELQSKFDKVNVLLAEDYNITGKTDKAELTAFKQFRFFQMLVHSIILVIRSTLISIIIKDNATKYISIESNNTNYQNPNIDYW